jgi:hypothetical protein
MRFFKIINLVIIFLCVSSNVFAACNRADLTGAWMVYYIGSDAIAGFCSLSILNTGTTTPISCTKANLTMLYGTMISLKISNSCVFSSIIDMGGQTRPIGIIASLSKGKDSMSGMVTERLTNSIYSGLFVGSKQ